MKMKKSDRKNLADGGFVKRAERKLTKLDRYFSRDSEATVKVDRERELYVIEVTVNGASMSFRAQERSENSYQALDVAVDSIERQIRKHRTRLGKRIRENAFDRTSMAPDEELPEEESLRIVRTKRFTVHPLTPEEAVLQMEMLGHAFFAFRNVEDENRISIVYRRSGGDFGLIAIE